MLQLQQFDQKVSKHIEMDNDFDSNKERNSHKLSDDRINQEGPSIQSRLFNKTTYNNTAASGKFKEKLPIKNSNEIDNKGEFNNKDKEIKFDTGSNSYSKNIKPESEISSFPFININLNNKKEGSSIHNYKELRKIKANTKDTLRDLYMKNMFKPESSMAEIIKIYHRDAQTILNYNLKTLRKLPSRKKSPEVQKNNYQEHKIQFNNNSKKPDLQFNLLRTGKSKSGYEKKIHNIIELDNTKNIINEKMLISKLNNSVKNIEIAGAHSHIVDNKINQRESQTGKNARIQKNDNIDKTPKFLHIKNTDTVFIDGNIDNRKADASINQTDHLRESYHPKPIIPNLESQKQANEEPSNLKTNKIIKTPSKQLCLTSHPFILSSKQSSPIKQLLRCQINSGNNSVLVKRVFLAKYQNWIISDSINNIFNFKWEMWSKNINFFSLGLAQRQCVNHFEGHKALTTKDNLFINLSQFCESIHQNVFDYVPLTFVFDTSTRNYSNYLNDFLKVFKLVSDVIYPSSHNDQINLINKYINELSFNRFYSFTKLKISDTQLDKYNTWILKPTSFNRGRGVSVFDNAFTLKKLIKSLCGGREESIYKPYLESELLRFKGKKKELLRNVVKSKKFIIQKYIEKPLLINGRKFDIRMWALLDHEMNVYLFKEGYLRTSARQFTLDHDLIPDKSIHLTNNAVQKNLKNYGEYEEGNQISLKDFQKYLDSIKSGIDVRNNLYAQMKQLIYLSLMSVNGKINPNDKTFQFEIFGYDFIVDINYKVWLIEVNTTPCLEESSGILRILLPRMLYDTFTLTLDKIFGNDPNNNQNCPFFVEGYDSKDNLWELVCEINSNRKNRGKRILTQNKFTFPEETLL